MISHESVRDYCLSKPGTSCDLPFDDDTLVFRVATKIFCITPVYSTLSINLKVEPAQGLLLRTKYDAVREGYHMNKKHWITVYPDGSIPQAELESWIDTSYKLVVSGLSKAQRAELERAGSVRVTE